MSPERRRILVELVTTTGRYHRDGKAELQQHDIPVDVAESIVSRLERVWTLKDAEAGRLIANIKAGIER